MQYQLLIPLDSSNLLAKLDIDYHALLDYLIDNLLNTPYSVTTVTSLAYQVAYTTVYLDDINLDEASKLELYGLLASLLTDLRTLILDYQLSLADYLVSTVDFSERMVLLNLKPKV